MPSSSDSTTGRIRAMVNRTIHPAWNTVSHTTEPIWKAAIRAIKYVTSSVYRFLIMLGIVLIAAGVVLWDGPTAAHLGIYGATALSIGVIGRFIVHSKIKGA